MACDSFTVEALILSQWFIKVTVHFTVNDILDILAILWNAAFRCLYLSFSLLFFLQLFVRPPQTAILLSCISFS